MSITIIGIGMGNIDNLTIKAWDTIKNSSVIIGSQRAVDSICKNISSKIIYETNPEKISDIVENLEEDLPVSILMSGDSGFFSGTEALSKTIKGKSVTVLPGISSLSYMAAKIKRPWQYVKSISAHGKNINIINELLTEKEMFFITGGKITAETIINTAYNNELKNFDFFIGERLSYDNEKITFGKASDLITENFEPLAVVWAVNNSFDDKKIFKGEIKDLDFLREKVPMTKQDIRSLVIKRLELKKGNVVYDIGGGTGSVAIGIALSSPSLKVFSVESEPLAYELILKNKEKFGAVNLEAVKGEAPEALKELPTQDCAFIGGSHGFISEILISLISKNKNTRIVLTAVTMETLLSAWEAFRVLNIKNIEMTEVSITNTEKLGNYNFLKSQNPVFLLSGGGIYDD